jgi:hypothetical protein
MSRLVYVKSAGVTLSNWFRFGIAAIPNLKLMVRLGADANDALPPSPDATLSYAVVSAPRPP